MFFHVDGLFLLFHFYEDSLTDTVIGRDRGQIKRTFVNLFVLIHFPSLSAAQTIASMKDRSFSITNSQHSDLRIRCLADKLFTYRKI